MGTYDEPRRTRTVDHRIKSPVLYQLSYRPNNSAFTEHTVY